ncbi:MAG: hypothetical protein IT180_04680 [Acidobacteria bacterium]|nr:hypothetical protein [Acidobacteriota bacterium]
MAQFKVGDLVELRSGAEARRTAVSTDPVRYRAALAKDADRTSGTLLVSPGIEITDPLDALSERDLADLWRFYQAIPPARRTHRLTPRAAIKIADGNPGEQTMRRGFRVWQKVRSAERWTLPDPPKAEAFRVWRAHWERDRAPFEALALDDGLWTGLDDDGLWATGRPPLPDPDPPPNRPRDRFRRRPASPAAAPTKRRRRKSARDNALDTRRRAAKRDVEVVEGFERACEQTGRRWWFDFVERLIRESDPV